MNGARVVTDENIGDAILALCFTRQSPLENGQSQKDKNPGINHGEKTERKLCKAILNKESSTSVRNM